MIKEEKEKVWTLLVSELENDIWSKTYQIFTKTFGIKRREYLDTKEQIKIKKLFPSGGEDGKEKVRN